MENEENDVVVIQEDYQNDAIQNIKEIAITGAAGARSAAENTKELKTINQQLNDINYHLTNLEDYFIDNYILPEEIKKNEQTTEKNDKQEEETREETKSGDTETDNNEAVTIETVQQTLEETNIILNNTNNLLTVSVFAQGIIIGVLVLTILWRKYLK